MAYKEFINGELILKGTFKEGLKSGIWESWYLNSQLKSVENYQMGLKNGPFYYYDRAGKLIERTQYKNGIIEGKQKKMQGDTLVIRRFRKGKEMLPKVKDRFPGKRKDTLNIK